MVSILYLGCSKVRTCRYTDFHQKCLIYCNGRMWNLVVLVIHFSLRSDKLFWNGKKFLKVWEFSDSRKEAFCVFWSLSATLLQKSSTSNSIWVIATIWHHRKTKTRRKVLGSLLGITVVLGDVLRDGGGLARHKTLPMMNHNSYNIFKKHQKNIKIQI